MLVRSWHLLALGLLCANAGCVGASAPSVATAPALPLLPSAVLVDMADQPALFLGPEPDAPRIAFLSLEVPLLVTGPEVQGRVPVRIDGGLRARGYVPASRLVLRVQHRGQLRGAPVYVGPDHLLQLLGPAGSDSRLPVRASVRLGALVLGPFDGTYPVIGLGAERAPAAAELPAAGTSLLVPAGMVVDLSPTPEAPASVQLPAQAAPYEVVMVGQHERWLAVRAGEGPYVVGWTAALDPSTHANPAKVTAHAEVQRAASRDVPARVFGESGALKRVAAGAKIGFGDRVIGIFKQPGWARVLAVHDTGFADVFAAVDEGIAIRGLVHASDLSDPALSESDPALSGTTTPAATR